MGNSASKTAPKIIKQPSTTIDENFGKQIMQNIKLKESPFASNKKQAAVSSNLRKRMELDKQTEGTISWQNFPLIFTNEQIKIDKNIVEDIKKYFSINK